MKKSCVYGHENEEENNYCQHRNEDGTKCGQTLRYEKFDRGRG